MEAGAPTVSPISLSTGHFFEVCLDIFDGPIDLLLHLVKQNELPIEKISLAQVASQYSACIEQMRAFDLDIAGEYLVIAATLLSIKSSILLDEPIPLIPDEEGNLYDPHEELLRRLREAQVYQDCAKELGRRDMLGFEVFSSPGCLDVVGEPPVQLKPHDALLLGKAFRKVLHKLSDKDQVLTITIEHVSIVEHMVTILDRLRAKSGSLSFVDLVAGDKTRGALVASFVALLELCKRQVIVVRQDEVFDEICVTLVSTEENEVAIPFDSEFDHEDAEREAHATLLEVVGGSGEHS